MWQFNFLRRIPQTVQVVSDDQVLVDLYARVNPSVVNITIYGSMDDQVVALGQGSGFVYDTLGNIITNAHVVHGASGDRSDLLGWAGACLPRWWAKT